MIHRSYRLLSHPLYGNMRPNQQPFRTILLEGPAERLDYDSLALIEEALGVYGSYGDLPSPDKFPHRDDLAYVDLKLIEHTLDIYGL